LTTPAVHPPASFSRPKTALSTIPGWLAVPAAALILLGAALWNRYPLTFWDTRAYLTHSITLAPRPDRVIGYSLLIRPLATLGTLWTVVAFQALALAWVLWIGARVALGRVAAARFLIVVAGLSLCSAIPWIAGQLMPDVFTPIMVLALFALVRGERDLGWGERTGLCGLITISAAVHVTHAVFGAMLVFVLLLAAPRGLRLRGSVAQAALTGGVALALGAGGMLGFNYSRTGRFTLASGGSAYLLAHLVDSGIASSVLDRHCDERGAAYLLCRWRKQLPMTPDDFLWNDRLPFRPFDHPVATRAEFRRLLGTSLRENPGLHARVAFDYTIGVLGSFGTGEGLDSLALPGLDSAVALVAPGDRPALDRSRQQHDGVPVRRLRRVDTPAGWIMLVVGAVVLLVAAFRRVDWWLDRPFLLLFTALAAILIYAVMCGNTSGIYQRYEARLVWLAGFALWTVAERGWRLPFGQPSSD
jgi:hypothetical protein